LGFLDKVLPLLRHTIRWENRFGWADVVTRTAINALVWVYKKLVIALVDALDWANLDTSAVFGSDTGLGNHRNNVFHTSSLHLLCGFVFD
jgi:hypothetical protein